MSKIIKLVFPLVPEFRLKLPVAAEVTEIEVKNDISRLVVAIDEIAVDADGQIREGVPRSEVIVRTYLEGERRGTGIFTGEPGNEREVMEEVPIPEESPELRKVGSFETVESPGKWHVFQVQIP